ncbi:hypothetical protein SELSPUOL_02195 [Selenomonas sputigena ATCC 35185]|uniref:Uncharacterized protein n=1 Tax=Selenomonas sputigena (strain ATCC 35185 / DSM 20758 / CCUG 44933 / VPI D19B-28) TaxID=546271 RepID=C9LXI8_SELS3|nr:hypothetical protein SELSPUOL_02195 [Selenomonas sputigena ATCC 35185]
MSITRLLLHSESTDKSRAALRKSPLEQGRQGGRLLKTLLYYHRNDSFASLQFTSLQFVCRDCSDEISKQILTPCRSLTIGPRIRPDDCSKIHSESRRIIFS